MPPSVRDGLEGTGEHAVLRSVEGAAAFQTACAWNEHLAAWAVRTTNCRNTGLIFLEVLSGSGQDPSNF